MWFSLPKEKWFSTSFCHPKTHSFLSSQKYTLICSALYVQWSVYNCILILWYYKFRFLSGILHCFWLLVSLTRHSFLPSLLSSTVGFHWLPRYFTVTLSSVLLRSSVFFWIFSFCWLHVLANLWYFLSFLKFFLHITSCCLFRLLLQEWWLIIELDLLFMCIFFSSCINFEEQELNIFFSVSALARATSFQHWFCRWHFAYGISNHALPELRLSLWEDRREATVPVY